MSIKFKGFEMQNTKTTNTIQTQSKLHMSADVTDKPQSPEISINNLKGLTSAEAKDLLQKFGSNAIEEKEESWWHRLFRRFWGPISWMIEVAIILSAIAKRWEDFTVILLLLLINAIVDFYQESKALDAIAVLKKKLARTALVLRDGKWLNVDAKEIVPDDIVKIKIGDIVPADVKLLGDGEFLLVD